MESAVKSFVILAMFLLVISGCSSSGVLEDNNISTSKNEVTVMETDEIDKIEGMNSSCGVETGFQSTENRLQDMGTDVSFEKGIVNEFDNSDELLIEKLCTELLRDTDTFDEDIRVVSYNICNFNNDSNTYINDEKLDRLKRCFNTIDADYLCVQEDNFYIDDSHEKGSEEYFYSLKYPARCGVNGVTIHSKDEPIEKGVLCYSNVRLLRYAVYLKGEKRILIISTHLSISREGGEEARKIQFNELFSWLQGEIGLRIYDSSDYKMVPEYTHCIIGMDSNVGTEIDQMNLVEAAKNSGFILANGGQDKWIDTCLRGGTAPNDNIIVSSNIEIKKFVVLKEWYDLLYSDHVPIYCDLILK